MPEHIPKLGEIITGPAERDAVHVAVAPVVAAVQLKPGQHVGLRSEGLADSAAEHIGVVDPFLKAPVECGQQCYVFLYPGSAIGLRHVYRHPVLDAKQIRLETIELLTGKSKEAITKFADEIGLTYEQMMSFAEQWLRTGEEINWDGSMSGDFSFDEFWKHYEIVTCAEVPMEQKQDFFTCCM